MRVRELVRLIWARVPAGSGMLADVALRLERLEQYVHQRVHKADSDLQAVAMRLEVVRVMAQGLGDRTVEVRVSVDDHLALALETNARLAHRLAALTRDPDDAVTAEEADRALAAHKDRNVK